MISGLIYSQLKCAIDGYSLWGLVEGSTSWYTSWWRSDVKLCAGFSYFLPDDVGRLLPVGWTSYAELPVVAYYDVWEMSAPRCGVWQVCQVMTQGCCEKHYCLPLSAVWRDGGGVELCQSSGCFVQSVCIVSGACCRSLVFAMMSWSGLLLAVGHDGGPCTIRWLMYIQMLDEVTETLIYSWTHIGGTLCFLI